MCKQTVRKPSVWHISQSASSEQREVERTTRADPATRLQLDGTNAIHQGQIGVFGVTYPTLPGTSIAQSRDTIRDTWHYSVLIRLPRVDCVTHLFNRSSLLRSHYYYLCMFTDISYGDNVNIVSNDYYNITRQTISKKNNLYSMPLPSFYTANTLLYLHILCQIFVMQWSDTYLEPSIFEKSASANLPRGNVTTTSAYIIDYSSSIIISAV